MVLVQILMEDKMTYVAKLDLRDDEMDLVRKAKNETKQSLTQFVAYATVKRAKEVLAEEAN